MKVSFRETGTTQEPVTHTQEEMREYKRVKRPVFKMVVIFLTLLVLLFAVIALYKRNTLYAYGIVSGSTVPVTAGFSTEIQTVRVAKGDVVKRGDVLFTQVSMEGEARLKAAQAALHGKRAQYDLMKSPLASGEGVETAGDQRGALKNERELLALKRRGAAITRDRLRSEARYDKSRLKTLYEAKSKRYENLQKLYRLDAATLSQLTAAETEKKLRYNDYLLARDHYDRVIKANRIAKLEARKEGIKGNSILRSEALRMQTELETARADLWQLQSRYGTKIYKAPFDAIITEVNVAPGSVVAAGESILTSVSLAPLWVDVYVEAEDAPLFTEEKEILLYGAGSRQAISGTLATRGGVQLRLPPPLREMMPGISSAVYFHVGYDNNGRMLPGNIVKVVVK